MALPIVPLLFVGGLTGASGLFTGFSLSNKLGTAFTVAGIVLGLFLIFVLVQRYELFG